MRARGAAALLFVAALPLAAQTMTGIAPVDSASVARAAYARASSALRENRLADGRRDIDRAATAWPIQPAYLWASAVQAMRAGDTVALLARLSDYAALGIGRDLSNPMISGYFNTSQRLAIKTTHQANLEPKVRSTVRATLADTTFWPEGIDVNPANGNIYVTSVRHRTIAEIRPDGSSHELLKRQQASLGAILAVRVDAERGVLWATTSGIPQMEGFQPADSAIAALLCIRLADGAIVRRVDLPVGQHVLGDVALSGRDVFFTDSRDAALYWLRATDDSLVRINSPLLRSPQGVAPKGDGRIVYVADYSHGLVQVDLTTRSVSWLGRAPGSTPVGLDGIVFRDESIIGIQNGVSPARVVRFLLDNAGLRIMGSIVLDQNSGVADEPTIGALTASEFLYVANSQWEKHDDTGAPKAGVARTAPVILAVRLSRP